MKARKVKFPTEAEILALGHTDMEPDDGSKLNVYIENNLSGLKISNRKFDREAINMAAEYNKIEETFKKWKEFFK